MDEERELKCPHCGHIFSLDFIICPNCGKKSKRCPHCGEASIFDFSICPNCGKK